MTRKAAYRHNIETFERLLDNHEITFKEVELNSEYNWIYVNFGYVGEPEVQVKNGRLYKPNYYFFFERDENKVELACKDGIRKTRCLDKTKLTGDYNRLLEKVRNY